MRDEVVPRRDSMPSWSDGCNNIFAVIKHAMPRSVSCATGLPVLARWQRPCLRDPGLDVAATPGYTPHRLLQCRGRSVLAEESIQIPSPATGLPRLCDPRSRRAVPITPADRSRCICRLLPQTVLPSPNSERVGVHNFPFEACSGFTHVTAR